MTSQSFDTCLDELMFASTIEAEKQSPMLAGMMRYHMGWVDRDFSPVHPGSIDRGKRIRPRLASLTCRAIAGDDSPAAHLAAAIELLHNFTLVHDDIQDQSPFRRHRETVWSLWGPAQAINTGDALYAASRRTLLKMATTGVTAERVLAIADEFDRVALEIVAGQVADLELEGGIEATHQAYLDMISRKTAAIVEFASWAGAFAAGSSADIAGRFGRFGRSLGLGFQIRDDVLGIWGDPQVTGKPAADDIRRRKQSLPIILLREASSIADRESLASIYVKVDPPDDDVQEVLALLDTYQIRSAVESYVIRYHDTSVALLEELAVDSHVEPIAELREFVSGLALRAF